VKCFSRFRKFRSRISLITFRYDGAVVQTALVIFERQAVLAFYHEVSLERDAVCLEKIAIPRWKMFHAIRAIYFVTCLPIIDGKPESLPPHGSFTGNELQLFALRDSVFDFGETFDKCRERADGFVF